MSAEDVDELRELGLSDAEIFDIVAAAAAARCFFSKTGRLRIRDAEFAELAPGPSGASRQGRPLAYLRNARPAGYANSQRVVQPVEVQH